LLWNSTLKSKTKRDGDFEKIHAKTEAKFSTTVYEMKELDDYPKSEL